MGATVSSSTGEPVGRNKGTPVEPPCSGVSVRVIVGSVTLETVGRMLLTTGANVGIVVGSVTGMLVGVNVGRDVSSVTGAWVGGKTICTGARVGDMVACIGVIVGLTVTTGVGAAVDGAAVTGAAVGATEVVGAYVSSTHMSLLLLLLLLFFFFDSLLLKLFVALVFLLIDTEFVVLGELLSDFDFFLLYAFEFFEDDPFKRRSLLLLDAQPPFPFFLLLMFDSVVSAGEVEGSSTTNPILKDLLFTFFLLLLLLFNASNGATNAGAVSAPTIVDELCLLFFVPLLPVFLPCLWLLLRFE